MRLKIVKVSRVFCSPAPFKAQLLRILYIARFQYFPCIVLVFLGNLRGKEAKKLLLLGVPGVAQTNSFHWWQQPQPTFLSIAWGEINLAQLIGNLNMIILLLEMSSSFVYPSNQPS